MNGIGPADSECATAVDGAQLPPSYIGKMPLLYLANVHVVTPFASEYPLYGEMYIGDLLAAWILSLIISVTTFLSVAACYSAFGRRALTALKAFGVVATISPPK